MQIAISPIQQNPKNNKQMNRLISTLGKQKPSKLDEQSSSTFINHKSIKHKANSSIWLLDGDIQAELDVNVDVNLKFVEMVKALVEKKFFNQKYLDQVEQLYDQIINQLFLHLQDVPSELPKLTRIESAIVQISDSYLGEVKNHLKNFQSLLDVRIRKLKRKQKKTDLSEFDKILHDNKQLMKKKHQVMYIDEDRDQKKHIQRKVKNGKVFQAQSKKSYGTMNSGSNENQSGSGRKSGGSQSRSSEGNALAVLLSNREVKRKQDEKVDKSDKTVNESYNFSAIMCSSVAVRQRSDKKGQSKQVEEFDETTNNAQNKVKKKEIEEKDEAFIFHRPKKAKK